MIRRMCEINNYKSQSHSSDEEFKKRAINKYGLDMDIEVSELLKSEEKENVEKELSWIKKRFDYAIECISDYDNNFSQKDMKDMLDEL